jgi:hypothetical protein
MFPKPQRQEWAAAAVALRARLKQAERALLGTETYLYGAQTGHVGELARLLEQEEFENVAEREADAKVQPPLVPPSDPPHALL